MFLAFSLIGTVGILSCRPVVEGGIRKMGGTKRRGYWRLSLSRFAQSCGKYKRFPNRLAVCIQFSNVLVAQFYSINFITLLKFNANSTSSVTAFLKKIPRQIKGNCC